ncbi:hypothetical protein [Aquihabitans sp. McL0605]|uniref:hypothetical protein n=1 Tax=Aquihabitans sp. McL0605 TaxID=3415671 RepID=UPI003CE7A566
MELRDATSESDVGRLPDGPFEPELVEHLADGRRVYELSQITVDDGVLRMGRTDLPSMIDVVLHRGSTTKKDPYVDDDAYVDFDAVKEPGIVTGNNRHLYADYKAKGRCYVPTD